MPIYEADPVEDTEIPAILLCHGERSAADDLRWPKRSSG